MRGIRILTHFLSSCRLRTTLGPTNPRLINSAEEPYPFGGADSHHTVLLSSQDSHSYAVSKTSKPTFRPHVLPRYHIIFRWSEVSVMSFSPVHFPGPAARPVSHLRTLSGWLLLSPPSGCFRPRTRFICDT